MRFYAIRYSNGRLRTHHASRRMPALYTHKGVAESLARIGYGSRHGATVVEVELTFREIMDEPDTGQTV